jgi:two-component system, sensor histidine kinase PdtaS
MVSSETVPRPFCLLFEGETDCAITVEAAEIDIPTAFAIPLALILHELITNSAKYAKSNIAVRLETSPIIGHSLSVSDDGPGLPEGFDPARRQRPWNHSDLG